MKTRYWNPENDTLNKLMGALDDIQYLEPSFALQIDQIHSYLIDLSEQKNEYSGKGESHKFAPAKFVERAIEKFFFDNTSFLKLKNFHINYIGNPGLEFLCRVEQVLSECLMTLEVFSIENSLHITIEENHFYLSFPVKDVKNHSESRKYLRSITKKFLSKNIILTYEHVCSPHRGQIIILDFDFEYAEESKKIHQVSEKILLAMPKVVENYEIRFAEDFPTLPHLVLSIGQDLNLSVKRTLPKQLAEQFSLVSSDREISFYHFPFLFRPVSIIIPNVVNNFCENSDSFSDGNKSSTGSVMTKDYGKTDNYVIGHIDFFKFF
jgi:hypothetical protein